MAADKAHAGRTVLPLLPLFAEQTMIRLGLSPQEGDGWH